MIVIAALFCAKEAKNAKNAKNAKKIIW